LLYCHFFWCTTSCHFLCCCLLWFLFTFFLISFFFFPSPSSRRSHVPDCNVSILFLIEISCKCVSNFNRDNLLVLFLNVSCKYKCSSLSPFGGVWFYLTLTPIYFGFELRKRRASTTLHVSHQKLHHSSLSQQCFPSSFIYFLLVLVFLPWHLVILTLLDIYDRDCLQLIFYVLELCVFVCINQSQDAHFCTFILILKTSFIIWMHLAWYNILRWYWIKMEIKHS